MTPEIESVPVLNVLIIEDKDGPAKALARTINETVPNSKTTIIRNFQRALKLLDSPHPFHAVVLDLYDGDTGEADAKIGEEIWKRIWQTKLIPVIIHTGYDPELSPSIPVNNPFIKCFSKKAGSDKEVADMLVATRPHILALGNVEHEFDLAINSVIAETSPLIWQMTESDQEHRKDLLVRSARRRLAASMDLKTISTDEPLQSWEQYIYPPIEESLLLGDLLVLTGGKGNDPESYRLVLTPSCDLQMNKGKCKTTEVLVAKCARINKFIEIVRFQSQSGGLEKQLPRFLNEPHLGGHVPLPEYGSLLPCMAANLRKLELIPISDIDPRSVAGKKFRRIASIDSPFREQIAWAYLSITGRPGVPERDQEKWATQIISSLGRPATINTSEAVSKEDQGEKVPVPASTEVGQTNKVTVGPGERLKKVSSKKQSAGQSRKSRGK